MLILTQKKKYSSNFDTQGLFSFEKARDIWDVEKLIKDIRELETAQIKMLVIICQKNCITNIIL